MTDYETLIERFECALPHVSTQRPLFEAAITALRACQQVVTTAEWLTDDLMLRMRDAGEQAYHRTRTERPHAGSNVARDAMAKAMREVLESAQARPPAAPPKGWQPLSTAPEATPVLVVLAGLPYPVTAMRTKCRAEEKVWFLCMTGDGPSVRLNPLAWKPVEEVLESVPCAHCQGRGWFTANQYACEVCDGAGRIALFSAPAAPPAEPEGAISELDNPELYRFKIALGQDVLGMSTAQRTWRRDIITKVKQLQREADAFRQLSNLAESLRGSLAALAAPVRPHGEE